MSSIAVCARDFMVYLWPMGMNNCFMLVIMTCKFVSASLCHYIFDFEIKINHGQALEETRHIGVETM